MRMTMFRGVTLAALGAAAPLFAQELPNGVAAGDVTPDSAVLWARPEAPGLVLSFVSPSRTFSSELEWRLGGTLDPLEPIKFEVSGLRPGTTYYHVSFDTTGRWSAGVFRTPHLPGATHGLRFGVTGDSRGDNMPFHGVRNIPRRSLDFLVELGDTIYADIESPALPGVAQARTIEEYRQKHDEVLSETGGLNALEDARRSTALFATIDDHEVTNDFAGGAPSSTDPRFAPGFPFINETPLFETGLQAFQEFHPLRDEFYGDTADARTAFKRKLYRSRAFGDDAALFLLDARSFRDTELVPANILDPSDVLRFLIESFDPARTMLGAVQLSQLTQELAMAQAAGITWKFVMVPEPIQQLGPLAAEDRFEGYAAERTALLEFIRTNGITNVVFVAADIHGTLVNEVRSQAGPGAPQQPLGAFEITTGPIAFDAPFGPTVVAIGAQLGLVSQMAFQVYLAAPVAAKEQFLRAFLDVQVQAFGLDTLGLDGGEIDATLTAGQWSATHTYGWTEFEIDAVTQELTVSTWGADPQDPTTTPEIVQQFVVRPQ